LPSGVEDKDSRSSTKSKTQNHNACTCLVLLMPRLLLVCTSLIVNHAVAELMKPKPKPEAKSPKRTHTSNKELHRLALLPYALNPEAYPDAVVYYDDKFVVLKDAYPKSKVHLLILSRRHKEKTTGQDAFQDAQFLAEMREVEVRARKIAAEELRKQISKYSAIEAGRREAQEADDIPDVIPPGRDWEMEIMTGTHQHPSMDHLHVHVLSKDMTGEKLTKPNHYESFTTDFFIRMYEYPLATSDTRRGGDWPGGDLICWRCRRNFGRQFAKLRVHLEQEFDEWKRI
jgi:aprataxin